MRGGDGEVRARDHGSVVLHDFEPEADRLCEDVIRGLTAPVKKLQPKYFYDERGARLFEEICGLEAYYPTRTEISILERDLEEIAAAVGPNVRLVEFGSGSGIKTLLLLENLESPASYVPVDISRTQLLHFARSLVRRFPRLEVLPVCADYTGEYSLPAGRRPAARTVAFFPGSTLGNFERADAEAFLRRIRRLCGDGGGLLIGVDLEKDPAVLEHAYNDPQGVTAAFNLNLLQRINRECGADFDLHAFEHAAPYDAEAGRIEMRLVSRRAQEVRIGTDPAGAVLATVRFEVGEPIVTEYSHKYRPDDFEALASRSGWGVRRRWTDSREWFGVWLLHARPGFR
jgi:dimethylhistidine N-methyltransferase